MALKKIKKMSSDEDSIEIVARAKHLNPIVDKLNTISPTETGLAGDSISELTTNAGVAIDGILVKDGGIALTPNVTRYSKEVTLTAANLIAMYTTPVAVVAAPGAEYVVNFESAVLIYDSTGTAFTGGGAITINYGSGGAAVSTTLAATFLTGGGDKVWNMQKVEGTVGFTMPVNVGLVITNATGVFATGTGVCRLQITYTLNETNL